jgi:hypothetical protein
MVLGRYICTGFVNPTQEVMIFTNFIFFYPHFEAHTFCEHEGNVHAPFVREKSVWIAKEAL